MKPVVVAVLVSVCALVFLSVSLGVASHLGYISFEGEPGAPHISHLSNHEDNPSPDQTPFYAEPSQQPPVPAEPSQQPPVPGSVHQASVVVPVAAASLSVGAKVAISIAVILVVAGLAVGAYFLWQFYQEDIIKVIDPEKDQLEKAAIALKEEQERQAAADGLWKAKLISLGVSGVIGIILAAVIWVSEDRNENVSKIAKYMYLILFLVMPIITRVVYQSWSIFSLNIFALMFIFLALACTSELFKEGFKVEPLYKVLGGLSISCLVMTLIALFV